MRGAIRPTTATEAVQRALSQIVALPALPKGSPRTKPVPIAYRLHEVNGGKDPYAPHCAGWSYGDRTPTADCIGLVLWASGIDRCQPDYKGLFGEWLSCQPIVFDAKRIKRYCEYIGEDDTHGELAKPGDWLVNDDHIGMIVRPATEVSPLLVVDCSPRHARDSLRNAAVGLGGPWAADCIIVRPKFYVPEPA